MKTTTGKLKRILFVVILLPAVLGSASLTWAQATKPRLDIYGFTMLDAIYDGNAMDPSWAATERPSKIPVNCPGDPGCGAQGATTFSVRQTRLGVKGYMPTSLGEVKTIFEFDLFGTGPDAGKTTFRIRHAWGELGQFGAGQTWSLFMDPDVFPNTIDYWGPTGMIFVRNPQVRWTPYNQKGTKVAIALEAPNSAVDTGKAPELDPAAIGISGWTKYPDLTGQFRLDQHWGHLQAAGILRWLGYSNAGESIQGDKLGAGVNLSGSVKTIGRDSLLAQFAYGDGIASYMNDGGFDLAPAGTTVGSGAAALPLIGYLVYYDRYWNDYWSSSIGYSETIQRNSSGQLPSAYHQGQYFSMNLLYYPVGGVMVGVEFIWGRLILNNDHSGNDARGQFSTKWNF